MSDEVVVANRAFAYLLDEHLRDNLTPEVSDYVRRLVARRHAPKPEPPREVHTAITAPVRQIVRKAPDPLEAAKEYIHGCVTNNTPIDRTHIADMTGYGRDDVERLINGTICERSTGVPADVPPVVPQRTKRPMSDAQKAAISAGHARRREAKADSGT